MCLIAGYLQVSFILRCFLFQVAQLQSVCDRKSVCVLQMQRSQEGLLSRLEESMRRREEMWGRQLARTVAELQVTHRKC